MPLPQREANVEIANLLDTEWDSTNIDREFKTGWIGTGTWQEYNDHAQITLQIVSEDTSPTGIDPGGKGLTSWADGLIDCNIWVAYADDFSSAGKAKKHRYQLLREAHRIIENNAEGTTDANNEPVLTRLQTGVGQRLVEDDRDPVLFRALLPIAYQFHTAPE